MKRILCLILSLALLAAGCAGANEKKASESAADPSVTKAPASTDAPTLAPEDAPTAKPDRKTYAIRTAAAVEYPQNPNIGEIDWETYEALAAPWDEALRARRQAARDVPDIAAFVNSLFETAYEDGENLVFSPVNIYIALAMLAEITEGETRREIMDALGAESIEALREYVKSALSAETVDDGATSCLFGNSFWLRDGFPYKDAALDALRDIYFADSFSGDPADPDYSEALRSWLDEHTKGLLKDSVSNEKLDIDLVIALASTVYFKAAWSHEFSENLNTNEIFHAADGDAEAEFMHCSEDMWVIRGNSFIAVKKNLSGFDGGMWLILPNEGAELSEALAEWNGASFEQGFLHRVDLSMPKLDVSSDFDLMPSLEKLGIKLVSSGNGDFSPLTDREGILLSEAKHAARLTADEMGVEAAAYTLLVATEGMAMPTEAINVKLDRPFLFVLTGMSEAPLFVGAVNTIDRQ